MTVCPVCGNKPHFTVRCAKHGAPVCMAHCNDCEHFSGYETSVVHCFYRDKLIERQKREEAEKMLAEIIGK